MREETVTKNILNWLETNGWKIVCFDFPQSGTGHVLHPNEEYRTTKNHGAIIPDIVAIKNGIVIFLENKDRFVLADFLKINDLITNGLYSNSINKLLKTFQVSKIYYGIGMPFSDKYLIKSKQNIDKVDFVIFVKEDFSINLIDKFRIFE